MQNRNVTLGLLFGVFALGMIGIQQSYATDYILSNDGTCGGLVASLIAEWDSLTNTCTLIDDFYIEDTTDDKLEIQDSIIFVVPDGFEFSSEEGFITILGTLKNYGDFYNYGDIEFGSGTLENYANFDNQGSMDVSGDLTNHSYFSNGGDISVTGSFLNLDTLQNDHPFSVYMGGTLTNDGTIINNSVFTMEGTFTNNGSFTNNFFLTILVGAVVNNHGNIILSPTTQTNVLGTLHIASDGTLTNNEIIDMYPASEIIVDGSFDNVGEINNDNGHISVSGSFTGNDPNDLSVPQITITAPVANKKYGNVQPTELIGSATDLDGFGNVIDYTGDIMWSINHKYDSEDGDSPHPPIDVVLPDTGSPVYFTFTELGKNTITATITDPSSNENSTSVKIIIVQDHDGDGYVNSEDCDDHDEFVYLGAPERINGIDDDCNGSLIADEEDGDSDNYILGLFTPADWLAVPVPVGGNDCDDTESSINPSATEIFGDGIDNDCDGLTDNGFTDDDSDGYVLETVNVLHGFVDCDDSDVSINPAAIEIFDGIDNNCNGLVDEGFTDEDNDGYNLANDCDDTQASVNPGADELAVIDGVDTDCNPATTNPDEEDGDSDNYILGLFTPADWLAVPVPVGGNDCDDTQASVNPGATEVFNGIDDDCDGTIDFGLDDDNDGYFTGNILGVSDCLDRPATEGDYLGIDPATIHPGALEIFGDGIDNNCDDIIDEELVLLPELQGNLTDKQIKKFEKTVDKWNREIEKLQNEIEKLNDKADKEDAKGNTEKADALRAEAESNLHEIEVIEDEIAVVEMSIGVIPATEIPIHFQDKLSDKTVREMTKEIKINEMKIEKLNELAEKFDDRADKYADKNKQDKANSISEIADSLRAEAVVYEDLNQVLIIAIDYQPSDDNGHHDNGHHDNGHHDNGHLKIRKNK